MVGTTRVDAGASPGRVLGALKSRLSEDPAPLLADVLIE